MHDNQTGSDVSASGRSYAARWPDSERRYWRHGLVDPRLALRRVTLWTLLGIVITVAVRARRAIRRAAGRTVDVASRRDRRGRRGHNRCVDVRSDPARSRKSGSTTSSRCECRRILLATATVGSKARSPSSTSADSRRCPRATSDPRCLQRPWYRRKREGSPMRTRGRIVKCTGEGALLVFEHASDARHLAVTELHATVERDAPPARVAAAQASQRRELRRFRRRPRHRHLWSYSERREPCCRFGRGRGDPRGIRVYRGIGDVRTSAGPSRRASISETCRRRCECLLLPTP